MQDDKYVVFHRDQYDMWDRRELIPVPVEDAVVIRRQDVFAPPALDAYANAIVFAVETMKNLASKWKVPSNLHGEVERLEQIADYFHQQAVLAWDTKRKLPD